MTRAPEISVVIPTHNRWHLLSGTLRGALDQRDVDAQVGVVDDGPTEEPAGRLDQLESPPLRLVRNDRPRGVARARNRGIAEARAPWIAFLDDDDLWAPHKLRLQLDAAASEGAGFAYGAAAVVDENRTLIDIEAAPDPRTLEERICLANAIPAGCSNVIVAADLLCAAGGFDHRLSALADWDMWVRLAEAGRAAACPEPLVAYVEHSEGMHVRDLGHMVRELRYLAAKHRPRDAGAFDPVGYSRWLARTQRQAGRRLAAASVYLRGAVAFRDPGNLLRAVGALAGLRMGRRLDGELPRPAWLDLFSPAARA